MSNKPQSTDDERRKFEMHIRMMQASIFQLQDMLPVKESYVGSTLQQIDSLVSKLAREYKQGESE